MFNSSFYLTCWIFHFHHHFSFCCSIFFSFLYSVSISFFDILVLSTCLSFYWGFPYHFIHSLNAILFEIINGFIIDLWIPWKYTQLFYGFFGTSLRHSYWWYKNFGSHNFLASLVLCVSTLELVCCLNKSSWHKHVSCLEFHLLGPSWVSLLWFDMLDTVDL